MGRPLVLMGITSTALPQPGVQGYRNSCLLVSGVKPSGGVDQEHGFVLILIQTYQRTHRLLRPTSLQPWQPSILSLRRASRTWA